MAVFLAWTVAGLALAGCVTNKHQRAAGEVSYTPRNVMNMPLPAGFTRVALMPIVASPSLGVQTSLDGIRTALIGELLKAKRFEVIVLTNDDVRSWAGGHELTSLDSWPESLRDALKERQVDGVMLIELTSLKGFPPLQMGLKGRLTGLTEVFDASANTVYAGAKEFEKGTLLSVGKARSEGSIELSPSQFAKYAGYTLFRTLP